MTRFSFFTSLFTFLVVLTLVSCKKDFAEDHQRIEAQAASQMRSANPVNNARVAFARTLSRALHYAPLRAYVRQKVQQAHSTDYEMIYLAEKDKLIDGQKISAIMKSYAEQSILNQFGDDFFDKIIEICPLLAINMPDIDNLDATIWDENSIPNVAAVIEGDTAWVSLNATPISLEVSEQILTGDPTTLTLSVWDAETHYLVRSDGMMISGVHIRQIMPRMIAPSNGAVSDRGGDDEDPCASIYEQAMEYLTYYDISGTPFYLLEHNSLMEAYYQCVQGTIGGGNEPEPCTMPCERDCEDLDERLIDFQINNWQVFQNIRNQSFERKFVFHGQFVLVTIVNGATVVKTGIKYVSKALKKGDLLNCSSGPCSAKWVSADYRIWKDWKETELASPYYVDWAEVDNHKIEVGVNLNLGVSFKVGDITITSQVSAGFKRVGEATVELGGAPVFYCDPILMANNTGSLKFRCN